MNPTLSSVDPSQSLELDVLLQEYVRSWRAGEAPDIEDYARMHLEHADDIRELLPTVIFAEQLNPGAASSTQDLPQKHPVQLGTFTLGREIGRGGMGIVYEATQLQLSQKFAIKVLKNGVIASKLLHSRFACEAEAASRLHHPHIVPAKYYGFDANCSYLVMPKIDGISIDRLIAKIETNDQEIQARYDQICQDWGKIAELGAQLASALSHAHSHGMVHRDIKPANLILDRSGNSWVTDFGLAKVFADEGGLSRTGEVIGTPRYMAPEQVMGVTDARSDIYALGLTLYEILAGQHPQKPTSKEPTSKESKDCRTSVLEIPDLRTINPNVPESLASAIMKACSHYPEARYQSAREFEYTLNALRFDGNSDRRSFSRDILNTQHDQRRRTAVLSGILLVSFLSLFFYRESTEINDRVNDILFANHCQLGEYVPPSTNCSTYEVPGTNLIHVIAKVCLRSDDVEEYDEGVMYLDSTDLELTWDEVDQLVGIRFPGIEVPRNAIIRSAKICFYVERTDIAPTQLVISGIDDANPKTFVPTPYDLSKRPRTDQKVPWNPEPWTRNELVESPLCTEIVQHLVNLPEWHFGNAMGFVIEGKGIRTATAYDGNIHYGPYIEIQYEKVATDSSTAGQ